MTTLWTSWMLALLLGMRHASEPDHLAAVTSLLADRPSAKRGLWLGAVWGVGHAISLLIVGGVLLALRLQMPGDISDAFELGVSVMLLALGARSIRKALQAGSDGVRTSHVHGHEHHVHAGPRGHVHLGAWTMARGPLLIGLVHGLAGSGALTALALANMPSIGSGLVYMFLFGVGSVAGMALVTGLAGWPLHRLAQERRVRVGLTAAAGVVSLVLGVLWGWPLVLRLSGV